MWTCMVEKNNQPQEAIQYPLINTFSIGTFFKTVKIESTDTHISSLPMITGPDNI